MKQNWTYKKLGEVGTVIGGSTPKTDVAEFWNGDFAWITPAELDGSKYIHSTVRTITKEAIEKTNLTLLPVGTVLLSSRAPIGKVCITTIPMYCNQGFKNIVCSDKLNNEFLYWWLKGKNDYLNSLGVGATFKEISKRIVEQIIIPVPPIVTQSRIVSELDLLQSIIDKQKAQLKELDNLAQAVFYGMFGDPVVNEKGWEVKKISEVALVKIGPFGSLLHTSDYVKGGVPLVNPIHMKNGHIYTDDSFTISAEKREEMLPYLLKKGDVIFARRGEIGRCAIVSEKEDGYLCGTGSLFVRFTESINEVFVLYITKADAFIKSLVSKAKGATMLNINCKIVEDLKLPLPPLSLQQEFASKIELIERQKAAISKSVAETQKLFDYTMDKYFG